MPAFSTDDKIEVPSDLNSHSLEFRSRRGGAQHLWRTLVPGASTDLISFQPFNNSVEELLPPCLGWGN